MSTRKFLITGLGADTVETAVGARHNRFGHADFRGLSAGEMSRIDIDFKRGASAMAISLTPERFARQERNRRAAFQTLRAIRQFLDGMVAKGFRARLRTSHQPTGQRHVALDLLPETETAVIDSNVPPPELNTQPGNLDSLQERLLAVVEAMQGTLQRTDRLIAHIDQDVVPELAPTLRDARQTLDQQPRAILT